MALSIGIYPSLVCIPSSDDAFADAVQCVMAASPWIERPDELADVLRPYFPAVRVRRRELEGERFPTWYVYRDGSYPVDGRRAG